MGQQTPATTTDRRAELSALTVKQLYALAAELRIAGRSRMRKSVLIAAIIGAEVGIAETNALLDRFAGVTPTEELTTCGRSWTASGVRLTCDVRVTYEQAARPADGGRRPNAGARHEGPCYDAIRREWNWCTDQEHADALEWNEVLERESRFQAREVCGLQHGYVKPCTQRAGHTGSCDRATVSQRSSIPGRLTDDIAHMLDNPPTVAELIRTHPDTVTVDDLGRHVQQTAQGHLISLPAPKPEIPEDLCDHGIDVRYPCSICREDKGTS